MTYFPIFLLTITVIVLLGLVIVSDISRQETEKANRMSARYVAETLTRSLDGMEQSALKELNANDQIGSFVDDGQLAGREKSVLLYQVSRALRTLIEQNPGIHSIYIYRAEDGLIVWPNGMTTIDALGDRAFLEAGLSGKIAADRWSDVRVLRDAFSPSETPVVSLVKQLPLPFGDKGVAVINADVRELQSYLGDVADPHVSYLDVVDGSGQLVMSTDEEGAAYRTGNGVRQLTEIGVAEAGWTIRSGIKQGQLFGWFSLISYVWLAVGCVVIALSLGYVIYVSKRNYRPIQVMMNKLESIQLSSLPENRKVDDLSFIGQALEGLIMQSRRYEQDKQEHLVARRRQLFLELLEGTAGAAIDDWEELSPLPLEAYAAAPVAVLIAEVVSDVMLGESRSQERGTLRLAMQSILQDFLGEAGQPAWGEWVGSGQIGVICKLSGSGQSLESRAEACRRWMADNLGVSMIIAVGLSAQDWEELPLSYASAQAALGYKLTGGKLLIQAAELEGRSGQDAHAYWLSLSDMAKAFRVSHDGWKGQFKQLFLSFRRDRLDDRHIYLILAGLEKLLKKEIGTGAGVDDQVAEAWKRVDVERLSLQQMTLDELESELYSALEELYQAYTAACESDSFQTVVRELRAYMEARYDDPDLSLKHLSDRFGLAGKNVSQIFKDAFGENFGEVLVALRIGKAKRLLTGTELGQQEIAQQVGYSNSITFGRMFKRVVGVTPGEYRKRHAASAG